MSDETTARKQKRKMLRVKNILIIAFILVFAVGLGIEIYKHSNSRIDSILENNRGTFDYCANYFKPSSPQGFKPMEADEYDSKGQRFTDRTSVQFLEGHLAGEKIAAAVKTLDDAGVLKITVQGAEVKFFLDISMGIFYLDEELRAQDPELYYYPKDYLDQNRIEGDWYRFGDGPKK